MIILSERVCVIKILNDVRIQARPMPEIARIANSEDDEIRRTMGTMLAQRCGLHRNRLREATEF